VAVTTRTNEGMCTPGFAFFGVPLPKGVVRCELLHDLMWDVVNVHWVTQDGSKHSMPFEQTDEGVTAAIAAMTLTC
jgi:hypothetical protein